MSILFFSGIDISCQEFTNTRKITINKDDTTVIAGITAVLELAAVKCDVHYYWYSNSKIYSNQGGFSGNLLHGNYLKYDNQGNLLTKGQFNEGLKDGEWIWWYPNGLKKKVVSFREGKINGKEIHYSEMSERIYSAEYKNGILHGRQTVISNDTTFVIRYRNGQESKRKVIEIKQDSK